ncbi:MAG: right-handed parallel beta-helix repeat-containing protein [Woeseia sp.]
MNPRQTTWLPLVILGVLGLLAGLGRFLETSETESQFGVVPATIVVDNGADRGPGTLRNALFMAMRAQHHVAIELRIPQVDLQISLPPVAVAHGLRISGALDVPTRIVNANDKSNSTVLLHLVSENIELSNIVFDAAGTNGISISAANVSIRDITVTNAATGLSAFNAERLNIADSRFTDNTDGVRIEGSTGSVSVSSSTFTNNSGSGLWVVFGIAPNESASTIVVHDNQFSGGRNGVTAANTVIDLRGNRLSGFSMSGLTLLSSRANITENRIVDSSGIGMHLAALTSSMVYQNEVGRNAAVGMLIVDANGLQVDSNEIYGNGYGIVTVGRQPVTAALRNNTLSSQIIDGLIAIGDTPTIDGNHALRNGQAGIRILDLLMPDSVLIPSTPRHMNNVLSDNGNDEILFGQYVVKAP